ncbi:MFS transporter [Commensalibacter papalotli (ex Botero et al. 2024)]|uniref:MFS family (AraJ) (PDB:4LDS) n=1 Tax=Commensalibacter papalotli (ex Botero et al. 2024) TaxID=2972766 RepID=A0ABM9HPA6_9PROT|nr:MFS transporter [Commensalibacter papalotli (ex Botero et al. 2024)]CAI3934825.1 MFS family (AraJ) (PDB:4LDS) [Commensalibacter papalotli (ex Botero et al. 2024)]CAI3940881.1 MFS family (AraJ) (PDB:4LDS) [Commensalibacter papalotli (ex Botero et al. 2024)]
MDITAVINKNDKAKIWTAHFILALGGLFIGTGEFAAMGLLPNIAQTFHINIPTAGYLISIYACGVIVGSPLLAIIGANMERKKLLCILIILVIIGNGTSALASNFTIEAIARFISGLPHGAYYGTAGLVAANLVPPHQRTQAIGRVMLGLAAANLVGVPLVTWMGQLWGWQSTFYLISFGGLLLLFLFPFTIPTIQPNHNISPLQEISALNSKQVWLTLATAAIGFGGMFAVYSYITPTLLYVTHQTELQVPIFLALWGMGMVIGNIIGAWMADKSLIKTIIGLLIWNAVFLALFSFIAHSPLLVLICLLLIGMGFALVPALQASLMDLAPKAQILASAMNHSAFNLANAIGAWAGGVVISIGLGWSSIGIVGSALAICGLVIFMFSIMILKKSNN